MVRNIFSVLVSMTMFGAVCARAEHFGGDPNRSQAQPQMGVMVNGTCVPGFPGNVPVSNPPVTKPVAPPADEAPVRDDAKKPAVKPKAADEKKDTKVDTTGQEKKDEAGKGPVAAKGSQLIEKNCASCHNGTKQSKIADLSSSMVEQAMKGELTGEGIDPMPKGSSALSEADQKEIVDHLKSLEAAKK